MLEELSAAPEFSLPDAGGVLHTLGEYRGRWVLIYFYPKDDTPGCTKEACSMRDNFPNFENLNAIILGVSADDAASHARFAEKYNFSFTLLSDEKRAMIEAYGAENGGRTKRISYLVNPEGIICKAYPSVKPEEHAKEVLKDLAELQK